MQPDGVEILDADGYTLGVIGKKRFPSERRRQGPRYALPEAEPRRRGPAVALAREAADFVATWEYGELDHREHHQGEFLDVFVGWKVTAVALRHTFGYGARPLSNERGSGQRLHPNRPKASGAFAPARRPGDARGHRHRLRPRFADSRAACGNPPRVGPGPRADHAALARRGCLVEAVGGSDLNGHKTTQASGGVGYGDSLQGTSIGFRRAIVAAGGLCPWRTALHEVAHCCDSLKWEADGRGRFSQTDEWTYIWLSAGCPDGDREEFFANAAARCWAGVFPGGEFIEALPDMVPP